MHNNNYVYCIFTLSCTVPLDVSDAEQGSDLRPSIDLNYQKFRRTNDNTVTLMWIYNNTSSCADAEITMEAYTRTHSEAEGNAVSGGSLVDSHYLVPRGDGYFIIESSRENVYYRLIAGNDSSCSLSSPYFYHFSLNGRPCMHDQLLKVHSYYYFLSNIEVSLLLRKLKAQQPLRFPNTYATTVHYN